MFKIRKLGSTIKLYLRHDWRSAYMADIVVVEVEDITHS
jgi:hypothetical protein